MEGDGLVFLHLCACRKFSCTCTHVGSFPALVLMFLLNFSLEHIYVSCRLVYSGGLTSLKIQIEIAKIW